MSKHRVSAAVLFACATGLLAGHLLAQTAAAPAPAQRPQPTDAAGNPLAEDPTLAWPPASLTTAEITRLQKLVADYGQLGRYHNENATLPAAESGRVVFFGDSITDGWGRGANPAPFFPGKPYINRGIGGQTTSQMLVRFEQDVIDLRPAAVLILAGTNDIAGNTGAVSQEVIENNFRAMTDLATTHGTKVILASILPTDDYPWRRGLKPADKVRAFNTWLQGFCKEKGCTYLDYYTALATPTGGMKPGTSRDGVHPTTEGYAVMSPLAQAAIDRTLPAHP